MAPSPQQIQQALEIIEAQLKFLKTAFNGPAVPVISPTNPEEGVVGVFDGEFMTINGGKRLQVPPNYASKSMLVPGDTLRMIEDPSKDPAKAKFKQIGKVERAKATGLLTRKDGKFEVLTEEGSFKVLTAAIKHYLGEPGDTVTIQYPQNHTKGSYAAVEKVYKGGQSAPAPQPAPTEALPVAQIVHAAPTPEAISAVIETPVAATAPSMAPTQPNRIPTNSSNPGNQPKTQGSSSNRSGATSRTKPDNRTSKPSTKTKAPTKPRGETSPRQTSPAKPAPAPSVNREINLNPTGQTTSGEINLPDPIGEDDLV